jgi:sensor histidine kinase YesM
VVSISDKGRGFPEEVLKKLEKDEPIGNSIGLSNVHKRLKSIYGEEHGLKITSTPQGSTVEIHFFKTMIQQKK